MSKSSLSKTKLGRPSIFFKGLLSSIRNSIVAAPGSIIFVVTSVIIFYFLNAPFLEYERLILEKDQMYSLFRALEWDPQFDVARQNLLRAYEQAGLLEEAQALRQMTQTNTSIERQGIYRLSMPRGERPGMLEADTP